jgi:hypothetical protein
VTIIVSEALLHDRTSCKSGVFVISIFGATSATLTLAFHNDEAGKDVYVTPPVYACHVTIIFCSKLVVTLFIKHEYHVADHWARNGIVLVHHQTLSEVITNPVRSTAPELIIDTVKRAVSQDIIVCSDGEIVSHTEGIGL